MGANTLILQWRKPRYGGVKPLSQDHMSCVHDRSAQSWWGHSTPSPWGLGRAPPSPWALSWPPCFEMQLTPLLSPPPSPAVCFTTVFSLPSDTHVVWASLVAQMVKHLPANVGDPRSIPGSGRFLRRREWLPTPVFLPGESHGQRSLVGYSPWGRKQS